ncbi:MAG: sulfatase-like hydrolase/transferase, partial [Planctomycetes bacterium]|nr:sulfatase-like hydrolase/transferase [Planctomycetota bacterium]
EPVQSPTGLVEQYRSIARNEDEAQYFANVHNMDSAVGRLLETLDRMKLRENTVVYFSSDNGPETLKRYAGAKRSYGRPGELKGMKLWTHEAGIRVPGIIRWPGKTSPGTTISQPISSLDLLPTFCSLARVATSNIELDGMDVQRIFQGQQLAREKPLFWFYYNALNEQRAAMRDGRWKVLAKLTKPDGGSLPKFENISNENKDLVRSANLSEFSLYDLESDPAEMVDLSKRDPQRMRELEERINRLYQEVIGSMHIWP